jgi:hypothetical protein
MCERVKRAAQRLEATPAARHLEFVGFVVARCTPLGHLPPQASKQATEKQKILYILS